MRLYAAHLGLLMAVCTSAIEPLRPEDIPELWKWRDNFDSQLVDNVDCGTIKSPVPSFLKSKDYLQFCDAVGEDPNSETTSMIFGALFDLDPEGNIVGTMTDPLDERVGPSLVEGFYTNVVMRFQAIRQEDWSTRYSRISPWVKSVLHDVSGPWPRGDNVPKLSPYVLPVATIAGTCGPGMNMFYYGEHVIQRAVAYNFPEGDPDRTLLMESTKVRSTDPQVGPLRWYEFGFDQTENFDSGFLVSLRPALLAYLKDLKNLIKSKDGQ